MVLIATLTRGETAHSYTDSLLRTVARHPGTLVVSAPASVNTMSQQRGRAAQALLDSDAEHLLFADADMGWPTDALTQLLETGLPVVGGLCFGIQQTAEDGMGGFHTRPYPTVFDLIDGSYTIRWDYPRNTITQVSGTGTGFLLIHRDVLDKVGPGWFDRIPAPDGELLGEDLSFCHRLGELDIPVHVHTGVRTSHYKPVWVGEESYVQYRVASAIVKHRSEGREAR